MAIQMRRGQLANYDKSKMLPGEWGISIDNDSDNQKAFIAFAPGVDKEVLFVEDAEPRFSEMTEEATEEAEAWAHGNSFHFNDYASGDGSTYAFTLTYTPYSIIGVYVDDTAVSNYTVSGTTITLSAAPPSGSNNIRVYYVVNTTSDNARYYKEQAASSASSAYTSRTSAAESASSALSSAGSASSSASSASSSASTASTKAEEAANSASAASGSASTASTKASEASTSAGNASNSASTASTQAGNAEAWAVGTKNGIDVGSSDPQYHNNAKYYADQMGTISSDVDQLKNAITTKAEADGAYPDLTAGQLLSKNEASDSVPYNFRAVGQDATLEYTDAIVGGSVVGNQLYNYTRSNSPSCGLTSSVSNGTITISGTTTSTGNSGIFAWTDFVIGVDHVVLVRKDFELVGDDYIIDQYSTGTNVNIIDKPYKVSSDIGYIIPQLRVTNTGNNYNITNGHLFVYDLTKMFGTTIADYIYTLETATAGAGVAWLRKHFPKMFTYQEYNAGEIVSVQGLSQHVTVGFNQWDEEWESGYCMGSSGEVAPLSNSFVSKNYIHCFPSTSYYFKNTHNVCFYDESKNFIKRVFEGSGVDTTPSNAHYMKFDKRDSLTYSNDICINLSDPAKNGTYEPYQKHTYPLDDSLTLRGILKLDASNNLYADGDRYLPDGTVQRRYGERAYQSGDVTDGSTMITDGTNTVYKLTTQTTENADPYTVPQIVDPDGTEEYISTSIVPVGHESRYPLDIAGRLDKILTMPTANGTYTLRATVNNGAVSYAWVST